MRRQRLLTAVLGLLLLGGCSNGDSRSLGPVPTASSTTVPVATTALAPTTTPTTAVRASTTTTVGPRLVNGIPQVTATPARAPIGGQVRIEGSGFTDVMWQGGEHSLWLAGAAGGGCDLYAEATHSVTVSAAGRLSGELTVPAAGGCRMSGGAPRPVTAGTYQIVFSCTPCTIGQVEVTTSAVACPNVGFAANSDSVAGDIVAAGMTCAEVETFLRRAGGALGPVGDRGRVDVEGFACERTPSIVSVLPSADYRCASGSRQVLFHRT